MKCYGCGKQKNVNENEIYPYEEDMITDEPVTPLFVVHCEASPRWKAVVVCHECFHELQPDLWIDEKCWDMLDPVIPFDNLPDLLGNEFSAFSYPDL